MPIDLNISPEGSCSSNVASKNNDFGIELALEVGNQFDNLDDIFELYSEYGRQRGFSVKKGSQTYFKGSNDVRMKVYLCSFEGRPDEKRAKDKDAAYRKQQMRTECKARLRCCRESLEGPWKVTVFNTDHNHELLPQSQGYLLRCARKMTEGKGALVASLHAGGIGVTKAHRFLSNEAGGVQNIGFLKKDAYHHLDKLYSEQRQPEGDANALLKFFLERSNKETDFYSNIDLDDDDRIINFYFRDLRCKLDYEFFGDVIFVDATYRTNKYDLHCVPFTGINHHMSNVMFGIGFLSSETTESYEWLFTKFLESMGGKEPQIIFTDQCQAMMNGVDYIFREARHRLCHWHINRNSSKHFGALNQNHDFKKEWMFCMKKCETEEEFEDRWTAMIEDYKPTTSRDWFKNMYKLRKRWASVFTHDRFSGGACSTSRSESTNRVIKDLCSASCPLYDLVLKYELILKGWRETESAEDAANRGYPGGLLGQQRLLRNIAQVYTRSVFKVISDEAINSLSVDITKYPPNLQAAVLEYNVTWHGASERIRSVKFDQCTHYASCSCHMWETAGVICRHIIKVYSYSMVHMIPAALILQRWTKEAKNRIRHDHLIFDPSLGRPDFVRIMGCASRSMRLLNDLIHVSKGHNCEGIIDDCLEEMKAKVYARIKASKQGGSEADSKNTTIRDPKAKKTRGSKRPNSQQNSPKGKQGSKSKWTGTQTPRTHPSLSPTVSFYAGPSQYDDGSQMSAFNS